MKIYVENGKKYKNFKSLIKGNYQRCYGFIGTFKETYTDPQCCYRQCHEARRSFMDLYYIAKTYFPKVTKEEVAHFLIKEFPGVRSSYCTTILKHVFYRYKTNQKEVFYAASGNHNEAKKDSTNLTFTAIRKMADKFEADKEKKKAVKKVVAKPKKVIAKITSFMPAWDEDFNW